MRVPIDIWNSNSYREKCWNTEKSLIYDEPFSGEYLMIVTPTCKIYINTLKIRKWVTFMVWKTVKSKILEPGCSNFGIVLSKHRQGFIGHLKIGPPLTILVVAVDNLIFS